MGATTSIAEDNIKTASKSIWNLVPNVPSNKLLDFGLSSYNKSFVNFAVIVGIFAIAKSSVHLAKYALNNKKNQLPTKQQLLDKYGHLAWGLIANCKDN